MKIQSLNTCPADAATDAKPALRALAAADERGPTPLTEAELAHVAAAGAKLGIAGGSNKEQW